MDEIAAFAITSILTLLFSIPFSLAIIRHKESGQYEKDVEEGTFDQEEW